MVETGVPLDDEQLRELVDRLTDEGFLDFVQRFTEENSAVFANFDGQEHLHCYNALHAQYQRFFEARAEAWLCKKGHSFEAFQEAVQQGGLAQDIADSLLAVMDYEAFVALMQRQLAATN
ncbi:unnamed protein product, partial [Symbiodinium microadriaticum]